VASGTQNGRKAESRNVNGEKQQSLLKVFALPIPDSRIIFRREDVRNSFEGLVRALDKAVNSIGGGIESVNKLAKVSVFSGRRKDTLSQSA